MQLYLHLAFSEVPSRILTSRVVKLKETDLSTSGLSFLFILEFFCVLFINALFPFSFYCSHGYIVTLRPPSFDYKAIEKQRYYSCCKKVERQSEFSIEVMARYVTH